MYNFTMDVRGHIIEHYGFKAGKRGFFAEWRELSSSLQENLDIPGYEAAEQAYKQLKIQTQGSA